MENKMIKLVAEVMVTATVLLGCDSAQLSLDSDDADTEESVQDASDEDSTDDASEDISGDQSIRGDIALEDDQVIESEGYIDSEEKCYRVSVGRKESVDNEYDHIKDYFFVDDDGKEVSFDVGYPSKSDSMDSDRYVYNACDFEAEYIDVTFDGKKDIVISLGHAGAIGDMVHCAYVYEDGKFVYVKSFEEIPNYSINEEEKCIEGAIHDEVKKYTYEDHEFVSDDSLSTSSKCSQDDQSAYDSAELMDGDELSEDELEKFQEYFNQTDNYGFSVSSYRDAEQINWGYVFAYGAGIKNCDYSQDAVDAYLDANEYYDEVEYDLIALSGDDVREFVQKKTGLTDFDVASISGFIYVEEYDILFKQVSDFYDMNIYCQKGVRNGELIQIVYSVGSQNNNRRITLKETGDSDAPYRYVSNRELWEENADEIIEATIYDNSGTITCAVISAYNGLEVELIVDNQVTCLASLDLVNSEDIEQYSDVTEIEFCDVDGDGIGDMVAILSDGDSSIAILCMGYADEWEEGYYEGEVAVTKWLSENVDEMTADNVIRYIFDHQDEFKSI